MIAAVLCLLVGASAMKHVGSIGDLDQKLANVDKNALGVVLFYHPGLPRWNSGGKEVFEALDANLESRKDVEMLWADIEHVPELMKRHGFRSLPTLHVFPPNLDGTFPVEIPFVDAHNAVDYERAIDRLAMICLDSDNDVRDVAVDAAKILKDLDPVALKKHEAEYNRDGREKQWEAAVEAVGSAVLGDDRVNRSAILSMDDLDKDFVPVDVRKRMLEYELEILEEKILRRKRDVELRLRRYEFFLDLLQKGKDRGLPYLVNERAERLVRLFQSGFLDGVHNTEVRENLLLEIETIDPLLIKE